MRFAQIGLFLETFFEVIAASQQRFTKHLALMYFCRLENSTKLAETISRICQKYAKIILREDQFFIGKPI